MWRVMVDMVYPEVAIQFPSFSFISPSLNKSNLASTAMPKSPHRSSNIIPVGVFLRSFFFPLIGGSLFLFDRKALRYFRKDGHNWRKKKDGKTVREAHEKLKVPFTSAALVCWYYILVICFLELSSHVLSILSSFLDI